MRNVDRLKNLLIEILSNSDLESLSGKLLFQKGEKKIFLTHIPSFGPGILISPCPKSIKELKHIAISGLEIKAIQASVNGESEQLYLALYCRENLERMTSPFLQFVDDLISSFEMLDQDSFAILKAVLNKWRYFWAPLSCEVTKEWVKGLWGELNFILTFIDQFGSSIIIKWTGPEGLDHDFQGNGIGCEIKSTETVPPIMTVSNLRQLDNHFFEELYVVVFLLTQSIDGMTIDYLVGRIEEVIKNDLDLLEIFHRKLAAAGYRPYHLEQYREFSYQALQSALWYRVDDSFPKVTYQSFTKPLDSRIKEVRYKIELANLEKSSTQSANSALSKLCRMS
ncbi:PD-(D/E)XK motif protein [Bdellovibrio sp. HCB288]|uniref:PD-(D/E)XK motif protein n=1 Tax=Bdellovibrio sp. HCB288 TaxID=3394355 RepID=UPI0039B447E1